MLTRLTLGAAAVAAIAYFAPVSAAPVTTQTPVVGEALVQQVQWEGWRRRCRYWRHECAQRWGWGTGRYYRCLWRHDCGGRWRW
jgi:hypothetical protein